MPKPNKFDAFLDKTSPQLPQSSQHKKNVPSVTNRLTTVKIPESAYRELKLLKTVTGKTQLNLLSEAIHQYFAGQALENQQLQALAALVTDYQKQDGNQMTIDDFIYPN